MVPDLMEKIQKGFDSRLISSGKIRAFESRLKAGKASAGDVSEYAADIGDIAAAVLADTLTESALPNGRIYYNIADRTVMPLLHQIFSLVMDAAQKQQTADNKKTGIRIKAVSSDFPEDKLKDLMFKFSEIFDKAKDE